MKRLLKYFFKILLFTLCFGHSALAQPLGAVATQHPLATQAAARVLKEGGNAVDAAVAVALTLSVVEPYNSGLGGGGMALVWNAKTKKVHAIDFRETAPFRASAEMYLQPGIDPKASQIGPLAIAVPGELAGLESIHQRWGNLPWRSLFQEAIQFAEHGFLDPGELMQNVQQRKECLFRDYDSFRIYSPLLTNRSTKLLQSELAETLKKIRDRGAVEFYQGEVAQKIIGGLTMKGSIFEESDLAQYQVKERKPLHANFSWGKLWGMPLPTSGGTLVLHGMKLLEKSKKKEPENFSKNVEEYFLKTFEKIFKERSKMGDPDFPTTKNTTHLSVIDSQGNAVSMTLTLNLPFGSCVTAGKTGIMMNNEMDDFTTTPNRPNAFGLVQGDANQIEPGKRPLSSMSPTLVTKKDRVILAIGSPGGPRIITSVLQVLARHFLVGESLEAAIKNPRLHFQGEPKTIFVENDFMSESLKDGISIKKEKPWGNIQAVEWDVQQDKLHPLSDPRHQGLGAVVESH